MMKRYLLFICFSCFLGLTAFSQTTRYVTVTGKGTKNGLSWDNASDDIQMMINSSAAGDQVFVAIGKYVPKYTPADGQNFSATPTNARDKAFLMKNGVNLFGGFNPDSEIKTLADPRIIPNKDGITAGDGTILSGDLDNNDTYDSGIATGNTSSNNANNAYHVVLAVDNIAASANLNGFVITGGNANALASAAITVKGVNIPLNSGAGIYASSLFSVTLTNTSVNNNGSNNGGGIYCYSMALTNSSVNHNTASSSSSKGGGIYCHTSVTLTNSSVNNNRAFGDGGGIFSNSYSAFSVSLNNSSIANNRANNGGGIYSSSVALTSSSVNNNTASNGGGIYSFAYAVSATATTTMTLSNSIIANNTASSNGGGIYSSASAMSSAATASVILANSSVNNNTASTNGGGIFSSASSASSSNSSTFSSLITLINSSLNNNSASADGGGIYSVSSSSFYSTNSFSAVSLINSTFAANKGNTLIYFDYTENKKLEVYNSIVFGNVKNDNDVTNSTLATNSGTINKDVKNSLVQGEGNVTNGNLDGNSTNYTLANLFTDAVNHDYTLKNGSAAINKGSNQLYTDNGGNIGTDKDLAGSPRVFDIIIDMGAYENQTVQQILPVTFGEFNATKQANNIKLIWNTLNETNNKGFLVQKSTDGKHFTNLVFVESKGAQANNYTMFDHSPANGVNYYRLTQEDINGTQTYLGTKVVNYILANAEVKTWPNPVNSVLNISYVAGKYEQLTVFDINGTKLQSFNLKVNQDVAQIDLSIYPKGIYFVELKGTQGSYQTKVVK